MNTIAEAMPVPAGWQPATRRIREALEDEGVVILHGDDMPIDVDTWRSIERAVRALEYEAVQAGDAGDRHDVRVARLVNDIEKPAFLQRGAREIINAVMGPRWDDICRNAFELPAWCVRRAQAHLFSKGNFIGYHVDRASNPDYHFAVVLHFNAGFTGGDLVAYHPAKGRRVYRPQAGSILINRGDIPHEVTPVEEGERLTLALFLSSYAGPTRHARPSAQNA